MNKWMIWGETPLFLETPTKVLERDGGFEILFQFMFTTSSDSDPI